MKKAAILARRYAKAFLNVYEAELSREQIQSIAALTQQLAAIGTNLNLFITISTDIAQKQSLFARLFAAYKLPQSFNELARLLSDDNRLVLLPDVLEQLVKIYYERKRIMVCHIASAHPLDDRMRETIDQFLARQTGCAIMGEYRIDKQLIAGLRIMSGTVLWEYSIDKQLRAIERLSDKGSHGN